MGTVGRVGIGPDDLRGLNDSLISTDSSPTVAQYGTKGWQGGELYLNMKSQRGNQR